MDIMAWVGSDQPIMMGDIVQSTSKLFTDLLYMLKD